MPGRDRAADDWVARPPFRVLVVGASTVSWTSMMGGPRSDLALPRAIEANLRARGHDAEVRNTALLGQPTKGFFDTWERDVLQWSPDVVVCIAGHYELIHLLLPRWFERYANRANAMPGPVRDRYRKWVVRGLWKAAAKVQTTIDRPGRHLARRRLTRASRQLQRYIEITRRVQQPGFLVLEVMPPAPRQEAWFPGMPARTAVLDELLRDVVASFETPEVGYLPLTPIARRLYGDDRAAATPDGFHFTPALHREVAGSVADWIEKWATDKPRAGG